MEHPIAFHRAMDLGKAPKKLAGGPAPDVEEAFEVDYFLSHILRSVSDSILSHKFDEVVEDSDDEASGSKKNASKEDDLKNDKLLAVAKKKAPAATKAGGSGAGARGKEKVKGKKKVKVDDED
jgi:replication factor C subunit 1